MLQAPVHSPPRLLAVDLHRGAVIAAMIFVNYLGALPRIPALLLHADERPDTFTLPDLVFPGFLLIVGLAIPLSLEQARQRGVPGWRTLLHIAERTLGLLVAGVALEFHQTLVPEHTGMSELCWVLLFYLGLVLAWQRVTSLARGLGVALIVMLLVMFRGPALPGGGYAWIQHEWWGILGIIGWSYLAASVVYLVVGARPLALIAALATMLCLYVGGRHGHPLFLSPEVNGFADMGALFGSSSANVMLGVLAGTCFVTPQAVPQRLRFLLGLAGTAVVCGWLLRPLHGFSKNEATESFTLVTAGLQLLLFTGLYLLVDVAAQRRFTRPLAEIGQNALLAYLLPELCARLGELFHLQDLARRWLWPFADASLPAQLANTTAITTLVLTLCWWLTRQGLRLRF